jgi:hypothetical protein
MENWDATNNDEEIEKLSQIIQLISTRIKDLSFLFQKQKMALQNCRGKQEKIGATPDSSTQ